MSYLGRRQQGTKAAAGREGKKQLLFGAESENLKQTQLRWVGGGKMLRGIQIPGNLRDYLSPSYPH